MRTWLSVALFGGFGLMMLVFGVKHYNKAIRLQTDGVNTDGVVAESEYRRRRKGGSRYVTRVDFRDETGKTHRFQASTSDRRDPGTAVRVVYVPDDPAVADIVEAWGTRTSGAYLGFGVGTLMLGVGGYIAWRGGRRSTPDERRENG